MKRLSFILIFIFISTISFSQAKAEKTIRSAMDKQIHSWNKGDIVGFMDTYWRSDSLMFVGKTGVTYGWENTLANYKKGYPDTVSMGKLTFTILTIKQLSSKYYTVVGKWHLSRTVGNLQGHFSLLFKKIHNKWVIIQDHSS